MLARKVVGSKNFSKTGSATEKTKRFRPGQLALREIKKLQKSSDLLIPKLPFQRFVRDIATKCNPDVRFQS